MAAVMFDTAEFIEELEKEGIEHRQARALVNVVRRSQEVVLREVSVRAVSELDSKTEKTLLALENRVNSRFSEMENNTNKRFSEMENNTNNRFSEAESRVNSRFSEMESNINKRFSEVNDRFSEMENNTNNRFSEMENKMNIRFSETDKKIDLLRKDLEAVQLGVHKDMQALGDRLLIRLSIVMAALLGVTASVLRIWFMPT